MRTPLALLLALTAALSGCSPSGSPADAKGSAREGALTILYTADAQGYLEACACATGGMLGGIARRAVLVDSLREQDPAMLLVEAGDFATTPGPYGELVGKVAARAMAKMKYDAVLPGEVELNLGRGFWEEVNRLGLPIVHTNFGTPELGPPQREPLVLERDGQRIAVLGLLGPDLYFLPEARSRLELVPPLEAADAALKRLDQGRTDLVVALVHMRGGSVDSLARLHPEIDVLVAGHTSKDLAQPQAKGGPVLVSAGFLGQHVGALRLGGGEPAHMENRLIRLETSLPEDPEIARWAGIAARK